jgi:hypothetical protein
VLDTAQELQSLRKTLRESGRKLLFRAEVATVRNFRFLVRMYILICVCVFILYIYIYIYISMLFVSGGGGHGPKRPVLGACLALSACVLCCVCVWFLAPFP